MKTAAMLGLACVVVLLCATIPGSAQPTGLQNGLSPMELLGEYLFFDENLSTPPGQSCAVCHGPEVGFTGPDEAINMGGAVYPGAVHTKFGNRKPPSSAYAGDSPVLYFDGENWVGGMFWDGRATGWTLGDPLAEQAQGPFLNNLEQSNPNAQTVCRKVAQSDYAWLFEAVWGPGSLNWKKKTDVPATYEKIARSIAAYERSSKVNPFSSKYDLYLDGLVDLTAEEEAGLILFEGEKAKCSKCHPSGMDSPFTDFTYDNLGVPKNPKNPFYSMPTSINRDRKKWVDTGLGGFLKSIGMPYESELGKQKVPTLRNVDRRPYPGFVKAYGHNGYFKSLEEIVNFYNTRDVPGAGWPPPEVPQNVNTSELGDLGLTAEEEAQIVAFLKTLTDGYTP